MRKVVSETLVDVPNTFKINWLFQGIFHYDKHGRSCKLVFWEFLYVK
jgi:hypothetical protein